MALSLSCRRLLNSKQQTFIPSRRTGYVVLIPEVPRDHADDNALLRTTPLQEFSSLTPEKCYNGLIKRSLDFSSAFWKLEAEIKAKRMSVTPAELFHNYINPLEEVTLTLDNTWAVVKLLHSTNDKMLSQDNYGKIHYRAQQSRSEKFRSPLLLNYCKEVLKNYKTELTEEQIRLLSKFILEGRLNGMELSDSDYGVLQAVLDDLGKRRAQFQAKVKVASSIFKHPISDRNMVKNFPLDLLSAISDGKDPSLGPWTVTLQPHIVERFLEYCPDSLMRWNVWRAQVSCCDTDSETRTSLDMEEIRDSRNQQAKLMGYKNFADLAMETKMAGSVENVYSMLELLLEKARPAQAREIESLNKFALQNGFHKTLDIWDVPFWRRQQKIAAYSFNEDQLQAYFPFDTVLNGLFSLSKDLFGITIKERTGVDTWHQDVRFYDVFEDDSTSPIGSLYLDPYNRPGKLHLLDNSGWAISLRNRSTVGSVQLPQAAIVFNFPAPTLGKPSLLTFRNVEDLFGRFGHSLQTLLSKVSYAEVAGLSNVEWDAVEVSNNFMIHWLYSRKVMESISGHFETGDKIPTEVLDNLDRIRKHMTGFTLCKDIYYSTLDLELFSTTTFWRDIVRKLWPMHFVFPLDKDDSHPCTFTAVFAHDWTAAYFSHLWAQLIAADIFSAFQEVGLDNQNDIAIVGKRYRDIFLALGGACHSSEKFRRFRGRDPSPNALMLWLGLQKAPKSVVSE